jgi:hypothetical protein
MAAWLLPAAMAATSLASSIFGGSQASKAAKKANALVEQQRSRNEAWYNQRYNEDYTQTAEAQAAMNNARKVLQEQYQNTAATAAVTGATGTAVAQQKAAANKTLADTASSIAQAGQSRKDSIESQYQQNDNNYVTQMGNNLMGKATSISQAAGNASSTFTQLASMLAQSKNNNQD